MQDLRVRGLLAPVRPHDALKLAQAVPNERVRTWAIRRVLAIVYVEEPTLAESLADDVDDVDARDGFHALVAVLEARDDLATGLGLAERCVVERTRDRAFAIVVGAARSVDVAVDASDILSLRMLGWGPLSGF